MDMGGDYSTGGGTVQWYNSYLLFMLLWVRYPLTTMTKKRNLTLKRERESTFDLIISLASKNIDYGQEDSSIGKVLAVQT